MNVAYNITLHEEVRHEADMIARTVQKIADDVHTIRTIEAGSIRSAKLVSDFRQILQQTGGLVIPSESMRQDTRAAP